MTPWRPAFHRVARTDSTNRLAREFAEKGTSSLVVVADQQTAGRGTNSRSWASPSGGLYTSFIIPALTQRPQTHFSILAAVAMARILKVQLKWPNDCLISRKKVAGILCEALPGRELVIVGIGINVNTEDEALVPFNANPFPATSLRAETGKPWDLEVLLRDLVDEMAGIIDSYAGNGFHPLQMEWERYCPFIGQKVKLSGQSEPATFLGIDEIGAAVILATDGSRQTIASGEIVWF